MEGNEIEKAAEEYRKVRILKSSTWDNNGNILTDFTAGANWQKERENAELTRTSKELDDMTTKYNELSGNLPSKPPKSKPGHQSE